MPNDLDTLFPLPSPDPSPRFPAWLPGVTHASSAAVTAALKDNHERWHAFFNDIGFHNHGPHHLLAIYAMGAGAPLIEAAYQTHVAYMRPAFAAPEPITDANFFAHIGQRDFYGGYLAYFRAVLARKSVSEALEGFVFSPAYNLGESGGGAPPMLLHRFLATALHPMIHTGCGLEFGIPGLVAEGLAQTAVHPAQGVELLPPSLFKSKSKAEPGTLSRLAARLSLRGSSSSKDPDPAPLHAFAVLARVLGDPKYALPELKDMENGTFDRVSALVGGDLAALVEQWAVELGESPYEERLAQKVEELAWATVLIYGVGGWAGRARSPTRKFNADFFYMHLVTSSLFLPALVAHLSPRSAALLLRGHFVSALAWYVARGRPPLPLREFYAAVSASPAPPRALGGALPAERTLTPGDAAPNGWLPIVQTTLVHPEEHLCKLQRTLMHNARLYGLRPPGSAGDGADELEGADALDGTLFLRVAGLTADRMGWMREGEECAQWDRVGFFE